MLKYATLLWWAGAGGAAAAAKMRFCSTSASAMLVFWQYIEMSWLAGQEQEERPLLQNTHSESPYKAGFTSPTMGRLHSGAARALSRDFPTRTLSGPGALQHELEGGQLHAMPSYHSTVQQILL